MRLLHICFGLLLFVILWVLPGCKWEIDEPVSWNVDILTPIVHSTVTLADAIQDSSLLATDGSGKLVLLVRDTLVDLGLSDILEIPDTTYTNRFDLEAFRLGDQVFSEQINLATIARALSSQGNLIGDIILLNHGNILPSLPPISGLNSGNVPIDASSLFERAQLDEGQIEVTLTNRLPVDLNNVNFEVRNQIEGSVLFSGFISSLPQGVSETRSFSLAGLLVESDLSAALLNLDVPEANSVPVDTSDFVEFAFTARGLKARSATAIFPSQTVDSSSFPFEYTFSGENANIRIQSATIKSGKIEASVISTLEDSVEVIYELPSAQRNGEIPRVIARLDPAGPNGTFIFLEERDLAGYTLDFTQEGTAFNTLTQYYKINLIYSGNLVSLDQQDSVVLDVNLSSIVPEYIEGFFGTGSLNYAGLESLAGLGNLEVDQFNLDNPVLRLTFENSLGVNLSGTVNLLQGRNPNAPVFTSLSSPLFAQPLEIPGPLLPDTSKTVKTTFTFTPENSNIRELLQLLPNQISYDVDIGYNPQAFPPFEPTNFASSSGAVRGIMELELPLEGSISGLQFRDTTDFSFSMVEDSAKLNQGSLALQFDNEFPLEVVVSAAIFDSNWNLVEVLSQEGIIAAGAVNEAGIVETPAFSEITRDFSGASLQRLIQRSKYIVFLYSVSSRPSDESVKILSDYTVEARLVGSFNYNVNP